MPTNTRELAVPVEAADDASLNELLRVWVGGGRSHISARTGAFERDKETQVWGLALADIAAHVIAEMRRNDPSLGSSEGLRKSMHKTFEVRLRRNLAEAAAR